MTTSDSSGKLSNLPQLHRFVTGYNDSGKAIIREHNDYPWTPFDNFNMVFSVVYSTNSMPAGLNGDKDLHAPHEHTASQKQGRVDFAPGYTCTMHRTESLDNGIVLEGDIEMRLDSGDTSRLKRGDVAVQRGTQHQWVNTSHKSWARMIFVLQHVSPLTAGSVTLKEDLGEGGLPGSLVVSLNQPREQVKAGHP